MSATQAEVVAFVLAGAGELGTFKQRSGNVLRASVEVVRAFLLLAWKLKYLSHAALADVSARLEAIVRQAARWGQWFGA